MTASKNRFGELLVQNDNWKQRSFQGVVHDW
jgi:hypothetical protein